MIAKSECTRYISALVTAFTSTTYLILAFIKYQHNTTVNIIHCAIYDMYTVNRLFVVYFSCVSI